MPLLFGFFEVHLLSHWMKSQIAILTLGRTSVVRGLKVFNLSRFIGIRRIEWMVLGHRPSLKKCLEEVTGKCTQTEKGASRHNWWTLSRDTVFTTDCWVELDCSLGLPRLDFNSRIPPTPLSARVLRHGLKPHSMGLSLRAGVPVDLGSGDRVSAVIAWCQCPCFVYGNWFTHWIMLAIGNHNDVKSEWRFIHLSIYFSIIHLFIVPIIIIVYLLFIYLFIHYLFIHLFVYLFIHLFVYSFINLCHWFIREIKQRKQGK